MWDTNEQVMTNKEDKWAISFMIQGMAFLWKRLNIGKVLLEISHEEAMKIETILLDNGAEEALQFFKEVLKPRIRAKGSKDLDMSKSTGVMT
jgi:hypothetical protein